MFWIYKKMFTLQILYVLDVTKKWNLRVEIRDSNALNAEAKLEKKSFKKPPEKLNKNYIYQFHQLIDI